MATELWPMSRDSSNMSIAPDSSASVAKVWRSSCIFNVGFPKARAAGLNVYRCQEELADRAELHRTYVGSVERGERNIGLNNMYKLADELKVSVRDFF